MNKFVSLIFLLTLFVSCQKVQHNNNSEQREALLESELDKIDWNEVDTYPVFSSCDTLFNNEQQKNCFIKTMTTTLQEHLQRDTLQGKFSAIDSLKILVTIQANTTVHLKVHYMPDSLQVLRKRIDSLLASKEKDFPKLIPATKQGIPVSSGFVIPIILTKN